MRNWRGGRDKAMPDAASWPQHTIFKQYGGNARRLDPEGRRRSYRCPLLYRTARQNAPHAREGDCSPPAPRPKTLRGSFRRRLSATAAAYTGGNGKIRAYRRKRQRARSCLTAKN